MSHPSVGILRRLVVVPDAEAGDCLGLREGDVQGVRLSVGKRNEPHAAVVCGDVVAIDEPGGSQNIVRPGSDALSDTGAVGLTYPASARPAGTPAGR